MNKKTGALLLAAGFSNRFGSAKLLAHLDNGEPVIQQTLNRIVAVVEEVVVITRPDLAEALMPFAPNVQEFAEAERGMGASLAFGVGFAADWEACLICLADMPFISIDTYQKIADSAAANRIIIPTFNGKPGNPVAFGHDFYGDLRRLSGDAGGKPVIKQHMDQTQELSVQDPAILADIDTPLDLQKLQTSFA